MFFAHIARIAAIIACVLGTVLIYNGFRIMSGEVRQIDQAMARYSSSMPGQLIDKGIYMILFAIALGTLAEIGLWLRKAADKI